MLINHLRPETTKNGNLLNLMLKVLKEIGVNIDFWNFCHCHSGVIKFSRRKNANKVQIEKKKLTGKNLTLLGINKPVYMNDSPCTYHKPW